VREEEPKQRRADMANDAEELPQGPELHGIDGTPVETDPSLSLSHGVGSRVTCVDYFALPQTFQVGTVARHWVREDSWPDGLHFAYLVQLDNGRRVFARNDERFIRSSDAAPVYMPKVLAPRTIMKFKIDNVWRKGVLVALNEDWLESGEAPHIVHFEEGGSTGQGSYRKIWGTDDTIVMDSVDLIENLVKTFAVAYNDEHVSVPTNLTTVKQSLRFDVGDRVECNIDGRREAGIIMKCWYQESMVSQDRNEYFPYQIQLDIGHRIFAPEDTDHCVTKSSAPLPYSCYICCDSEFTKDNMIVRDCACRGDSSGWAHLECLKSWAKSNLASRQRKKPGFDVLQIGEDSYNPFESCKMCRQFFEFGTLSKSVLIDAWYDLFKDISDFTRYPTAIRATFSKCRLEIDHGDVEKAKSILLEKIRFARVIKEGKKERRISSNLRSREPARLPVRGAPQDPYSSLHERMSRRSIGTE